MKFNKMRNWNIPAGISERRERMRNVCIQADAQRSSDKMSRNRGGGEGGIKMKKRKRARERAEGEN